MTTHRTSLSRNVQRKENLLFSENLNISSNLKLLLRHFKVSVDVHLLAK